LALAAAFLPPARGFFALTAAAGALTGAVLALAAAFLPPARGFFALTAAAGALTGAFLSLAFLLLKGDTFGPAKKQPAIIHDWDQSRGLRFSRAGYFWSLADACLDPRSA